jgi:hypothetical protein
MSSLDDFCKRRARWLECLNSHDSHCVYQQLARMVGNIRTYKVIGPLASPSDYDRLKNVWNVCEDEVRNESTQFYDEFQSYLQSCREYCPG